MLMVQGACKGAWWAYAQEALKEAMPKSSYEGGKRRHHFTLSDKAYAHLSAIAGEARLSRSEALERILRSYSFYEATILQDDIWPDIIDHTLDPLPLSDGPLETV